jgi:LPXTG-motif cell wall-anchored protein
MLKILGYVLIAVSIPFWFILAQAMITGGHTDYNLGLIGLILALLGVWIYRLQVRR